MGRIAAPFGVRGWIKVHPYTETVDGLAHYPVWWLGAEGNWQEFRVRSCQAHGKGVIAELEGCADRGRAFALKGRLVAVPRSELPPRAKGEYYWVDLIGLAVVNLEGVALGTVAGVLETGANDVLQVQGERERLVPFLDHVVREVDLEGGVIRVDWGADY